MTETFTSTTNATPNSFDMKEQESIETIGAEETTFYNSIRNDLDLIAIHPKNDTVQNILDHSQNLR
jgi:hypothetical protein